ncbi:MAG: NADH-quinone oxidoreductase subunit J [Gammaproteobacteria bacterium]|nr:NADH-quinone oxidoreductase subunit J [Gammaproteobacteria bacterium]
MTELLTFYLFAAVAIVASALVVIRPKPMHSVLLLIVSFAALAGLYIGLDAPFAAVIQLVIYAGAIMVLFVFVVMLLNAHREDEKLGASLKGPLRAGVLLGAVLVAELVWALTRFGGGRGSLFARGAGEGPGEASVAELGRVLFTDYALAFEATSILIIVAMVGAVVLAKREL